MENKIKLENEDGTITVIDAFSVTEVSVDEKDFTDLRCKAKVTAYHIETLDGKVISRVDDPIMLSLPKEPEGINSNNKAYN
jgi:hypothetical protein